ncbi:MFS transporter [Amycolatopsis taiwanensis]|uniref:MFS transporter n=1 Tax=Amycolatopsis taiwanensis TaxID=342230 RepID=UPI0004AEB925|nr:MFS transporter [Amycolatopsis taiwanensis]
MLDNRVAVFVVFGLNGAAYGSWAPRVPALSDRLHVGPGPIGLALLAMTVSMLLTAAVSGRLVERFGARSVIFGSVMLACVLLPVIGSLTSVAWFVVTMVGVGAASGALDVSMNVAGVGVERRTGRPMMPVFHAGFSFGGLAASAAAGLAAAHHLSLARHLTAAAVVIALALLVVLRGLPGAVPRDKEAASSPRVAPGRRPVLWLLAAVALLSAVAEGASSDWSALLLVHVHGAGQGAAALAFSGFSLAMALTRLGGAWVQRRVGPTRTLVVGALLAGAGLAVAAVVPVTALAYAGFALAGAGLAASFPLALGLAGEAGKRDDDSGGEREIAFVTTIAYTGFVGGPPLIGGIAQFTSLTISFVVVAILAMSIAAAAVGARRARHREVTAQTLPPHGGLLS